VRLDAVVEEQRIAQCQGRRTGRAGPFGQHHRGHRTDQRLWRVADRAPPLGQTVCAGPREGVVVVPDVVEAPLGKERRARCTSMTRRGVTLTVP